MEETVTIYLSTYEKLKQDLIDAELEADMKEIEYDKKLNEVRDSLNKAENTLNEVISIVDSLVKEFDNTHPIYEKLGRLELLIKKD